MRIRSVKPEYWQHRMHKRLSVSASLLGAALLDYADDEGRFEAEGARIRGMLVPSIALEKEVEALLRELEGVGWLVLYAAMMDGIEVALAQIVAFELHQVIQRPKKSLLPPPPTGWVKVAGKWSYPDGAQAKAEGMSGRVNDSSMIRHGTVKGTVNDVSGDGENTVSGAVNDESLGNGRKEGKGKEGSEGTRARATSSSDLGSGIGDGGLGESGSGGDSLKNGGPTRTGHEDGSRGATNPTREAVIPTEDEVVAAGGRCVPAAAPAAYCRWWFRKFPSVMGGWLRRGFLMDWEWELERWWQRDLSAYTAGRHASCEPLPNGEELKNGAAGGTVPKWKRVKELEELISRHVANRDSVFYQKREATLEKRKELGRLVGELDQLRAQERGG